MRTVFLRTVWFWPDTFLLTLPKDLSLGIFMCACEVYLNGSPGALLRNRKSERMASSVLRTPQYLYTNSPLLDKRNKSRPRPAAGKKNIMSVSGSRAHKAEERLQADFLARDILEHLLLKQAKHGINGYTRLLPGSFRDVSKEHPCIKDEAFQSARRQIADACCYIQRQHGEEIAELCAKLDISDEQLQANFVEALDVTWKEPRNWGRFVSLFVAAYYICERIYTEEKSEKKINSVIGWLAQYLETQVVPWIVDHGGFVSAVCCVRSDTVRKKIRLQEY